jgi:DNA-binding CsgD family transcriptional regulator
MGFGGVVLDTTGDVILSNDSGTRVLAARELGNGADPAPDWSREAIKRLLRSAGSTRFRLDEDAWVLIPGQENQRGLVVHAAPLVNGAASGPHTALILIDLDQVPRPRAEALQRIFSLTAAEARLAVEVASGKSLEEVAEAVGTKLATVRNQLASVFMKTRTNRQGELVALLARLPCCPRRLVPV